jgi:hypothetical protein
MLYLAGFDISILSPGTLTIADGANPNIVATLNLLDGEDANGDASRLLFHYDAEFTITSQDRHQDARLRKWSRKPLSVCLTESMQTAATANGWSNPSSLVCTFSNSTGLYAFSRTGNFSLTWSSNVGRALFGVAAGQDQSGSASYQFSILPTYALLPQLRHVADTMASQEEDGAGSAVVNAAGEAHGISRYRPVFRRDWRQAWEPKERVLIDEAETARPWTHQHLYEHCRDGYPFIVRDGGFGVGADEVFKLRNDGMRRENDFAAPQYAAKHGVPYRCWVMGKIEGA